jgi:hypothetical protein
VKRLVTGVLVGLCVGATGAGAGTYAIVRPAATAEELRSARTAAGLVGSLLEDPGRRARTRLYDCWKGGCRFRAVGNSTCEGTLRVRPYGRDHDVWFSRLLCR